MEPSATPTAATILLVDDNPANLAVLTHTLTAQGWRVLVAQQGETGLQIAQRTQPDLILKYAHFLARTFEQRGLRQPEVFGEIYVSLNGERSRLFIDSTVNLADQSPGLGHYPWVLAYEK